MWSLYARSVEYSVGCIVAINTIRGKIISKTNYNEIGFFIRIEYDYIALLLNCYLDNPIRQIELI